MSLAGNAWQEPEGVGQYPFGTPQPNTGMHMLEITAQISESYRTRTMQGGFPALGRNSGIQLPFLMRCIMPPSGTRQERASNGDTGQHRRPRVL